jgi:hypothetical protein
VFSVVCPDLEIRDRIRELRRVPASNLIPHVKNWRRHPNKQKKAMRAVLKEIGYQDALLARQDESGQLILIDGHLRADLTPTQDLPVLILDVTEAEADKNPGDFGPIGEHGRTGHRRVDALDRGNRLGSAGLSSFAGGIKSAGERVERPH